jgi:hypothetical protein
MASDLNVRGPSALSRGGNPEIAKSSRSTSLLSYEWIEIETVACLAGFYDKNPLQAGPSRGPEEL